MAPGYSRRQLLGLAGGVLSAAALAAVAVRARESAGGEAPTPNKELLVLDEADPTARPRVFDTPGGIDYRLSAPTATATPTPTPAPTATPTRRAIAKPVWNSDLLRQVASSGPTDRPLVALTVDDGWYSRDPVIAVLEAKKVQLTLFLAGRPIAGDYGFVARALNAGCEIANHTMDHYNLTDKTAAYIQKDLQDFEDVVRGTVSNATTRPYMRPSGGSLNQTVIDASVAAGYRPVLWNVSSGDGSASTTPAQMVKYALDGARPGAIILMHFSERAVLALPPLIDGLRAKGLEPVSLTRLFETTSTAR